MNRAYAMTVAILIMVLVRPGGAGAEPSLGESGYWQAFARHGEPRWYARQLHLGAPAPPSWIERSVPALRKDARSAHQPPLLALARAPESLLHAGAASPPRQAEHRLFLAASRDPGLAPGPPRAPGAAFLSAVLEAPISPSIRFGEEEAVIVGVRGSF
jgi:hypothetical protein